MAQRILKYNVGDRVLVNKNPTEANQFLDQCEMMDSQKKFCGQVVTIVRISGLKWYKIKEDNEESDWADYDFKCLAHDYEANIRNNKATLSSLLE